MMSSAYHEVDDLHVSIGLPGAHEHDGLPADVDHGDGRATLCHELCQN